MTDFNRYNPYPTIATIRCPRCGNAAEFRKAFAVIDKKHWLWWSTRLWPSASATNWEGEARWQPGDPEPTWPGWIILEHDPTLHRWVKPSRGYETSDVGIIACMHCVGRRTHTLAWPTDAYFQFELPQGLLWAWNREGVGALIDFIASSARSPLMHGPNHALFLRHIPKCFLGAKDRRSIVRLLRRSLAEL